MLQTEGYITHPYLRTEKVRTGWGRWGRVIVKRCPVTGKELRERVNWTGPAPRGGGYCPHCGHVIKIG